MISTGLARCSATKRNHQPNQARILLRGFSYLRPQWKLTAGAYLWMLLIDAIAMINPQLIRWTIDHGIRVASEDAAPDIWLLTLAVGALLVLVVIKGIFTYFQGTWTEVASQDVAYDLRNEIKRKITQLSFSFHDQSEAGDLLSRSIQDVERIRFLTGRATFRVTEGIFLMLITATVMIWMDPRLGMLAVIAMPPLAFQSIRFGRIFGVQLRAAAADAALLLHRRCHSVIAVGCRSKAWQTGRRQAHYAGIRWPTCQVECYVLQFPRLTRRHRAEPCTRHFARG